MSRAVISRAVGVVAAASVVALAWSASASANDVTCTGFTRLDHTNLADHKVDYRFRCTDAIAGYSIVSFDEISSFDPEGVVQDPMTGVALNAESYSCEGLIPSNGEVCNGKASQGNVVTSGLNTTPLPCSARSNFYLIVADAKGAPSGVFTLGKPRGCPHPSRARKSRRRTPTRARRAHP
jgi:hypothetical protein